MPLVPGPTRAVRRARRLGTCLLLLGLLPFPARPAADPERFEFLEKRLGPAPVDHWAFRPPRPAPEPAVRDRSWPRTPIDTFILASLEAAHLAPAPPADRRTLLRRLSYDLTGLPPTPSEVEAFVRDPAPDAPQRLVDRLLASPRYGERWGRHWLDVARYADTKGYVYYYEESRFVHPHAYRDWVIRAFNDDLPYDRFLQLQIAGDLLLPELHPPSTPDDPARASTLRWPPSTHPPDVAAVGFLALGRRFLDLEPDIIDDRIDVLLRGTQALTVSCARCHDHKYDPISTRDYYSLYGVFLGSEERLVTLGSPGDPPPAPEFLDGLRTRTQTLETRFRAALAEVTLRLRERVKDYLLAVVDPARLPSDANVRPQPEDINPFNVRQWERFLAARTNTQDSLFAPWHAFARLPAPRFAERAPEIARDLRSGAPTVPPALLGRLLDPVPTSMSDVAGRYGDLLLEAHRQWRHALANLPPGTPPPSALPDPEAERLRQVLYGPDAPIHPPPGRIVDLDVHLYFDDPNRVALAKLQMELEQFLITNRFAAPCAVILADRPSQPPAHVFRRGDPLQRTEEVPRQFLHILSGPARQPFAHGSGRLELARAIGSPHNPLTARVLVNRVWAHLFGAGLVRTPSDFGLRCDPPSHPELLDWLACRFMADGWSVKNLLRLVLNSAVYRQASPPSEAHDSPAWARDPHNRLLGRFPRRRLDLEAFRDSLLAVAGDLDERPGGPAEPLHVPPYSRRRTVYGLVDRMHLPGLLRSFDFANPDTHSPGRHTTTMPQQALFLLNHPLLAERARRLAHRLAAIPADDVASRLDRLFSLALQRAPSPGEVADARGFLAAAALPEDAEPNPAPAQKPSGPQPPSTPPSHPRLDPWESLAQVLLVSNEFTFVD